MKARSALSVAALAVFVAGCAQDGTLATSTLNTSALPQQTAAQDQAKAECAALASQIAALTRDGTAEKVTKAASKKYKMKTADLAKADELNKANAQFRVKCSAYPPVPTVAAAPPKPSPATPKAAAKPASKSAPKAAAKAVPKKVAKAKPPVPSPKPVAAAMAPPTTGTFAQTPAQP